MTPAAAPRFVGEQAQERKPKWTRDDDAGSATSWASTDAANRRIGTNVAAMKVFMLRLPSSFPAGFVAALWFTELCGS